VLGETLLDQRKFAEAEPVARECLALREAEAPDHWRRYSPQSLLGASLAGQRKFAEAEPLLLEAVRELAEQGAATETRTKVLRRVADLYEAWGRPGAAAAATEVGRALPLLQSAEARFRDRDFPKAEADGRAAAAILREVARGGAGDPMLLDIELSCALGWTGRALLSQGRHADAEAVLRECLALRRERMPDHQRSYVVQSYLGESLIGQRKYAEAEPLLVEAARKMAESGVAAETQAWARQRVADLYEAWGRPEQAAEWRAPVSTAR
jgi:tetratricopeptide (TPR) repeat protein